MATPLINTTPVITHVPLDVGSGSYPRTSDPLDMESPTSIAPRDHVYYLLTGLLLGHSLNSAPTTLLREKPADPVGSWLASTEGMLLETDGSPPGTYARALDELKEGLGVTLTYVARCLAMQRSAVYRWYDGRQPHATNRSRLKTLQEFASAWRAAKLPSLRNYWDTPIPETGTTLGQLLSADVLEINALRAAIAHLGAGIAPPKRPRLGFPERKRDRQKDRERLYDLVSPTSHEDDGEGEQG